MIKKIIVTGGEGRFAKELERIKIYYKFIFRNKHELNILSLNSIKIILKNLDLTMFFILLVYPDQCQFMIKTSVRV